MPDIQEIESLGATFSRLPEKLTLWNLVYILVIIVAAMTRMAPSICAAPVIMFLI